ncbi:MAG: SDR family NAD(P)-dependent oxidoreductase [Spirochaetes bacterium]|jgi:NAD(P)-dependent dehydrogenase (short-subunit alcohol dehydrogenase family)|nr:SDR family NAD(P)-dependent oxidoreductase [Spirochaetota bacterium]
MKAGEDHTVLVTGSTDGIGLLLAGRFAEAGFHVIVHGRSEDRCAQALEQIRRRHAEAHLSSVVVDLADLAQVRTAGEQLAALTDSLDLLVNNAGVGPGKLGQEREVSADGYELRYAVNVLGPFALTHEALPLLRRSAAARIVNVASAAQSEINFDDVMMESDFDCRRAYAQSKLAVIMFTFELAERLEQEGISAVAAHPGTHLDTKMVREAHGTAHGPAGRGADNLFAVATDAELVGTTGIYFHEQTEQEAHEQASDSAARARLWKLNETLTGTPWT